MAVVAFLLDPKLIDPRFPLDREIPSPRLLGALVAQAQAQGASWGTLQAIVEEASELGAARALERLGLSDPTAARDITALRELLDAWRDARRVAWRTAVRWLATVLLVAMMAGLLVQSRIWPPES